MVYGAYPDLQILSELYFVFALVYMSRILTWKKAFNTTKKKHSMQAKKQHSMQVKKTFNASKIKHSMQIKKNIQYK